MPEAMRFSRGMSSVPYTESSKVLAVQWWMERALWARWRATAESLSRRSYSSSDSSSTLGASLGRAARSAPDTASSTKRSLTREATRAVGCMTARSLMPSQKLSRSSRLAAM